MDEFLTKVKEFIYTWDPNILKPIILIIALFIAGVAGLVARYLMQSKELREKYLETTDAAKQKLTKGMQETGLKILSYELTEDYIKRSGLYFMTGGKITPLSYMAMRFGAAAFGLIVGLQFSVIAAPILMVVLFLAPDFIINESNKSDNSKMLDDIKNVYDTMRIQSKAGVYISDILSDCYTVVANRRLKDAFLKLSSDIMAQSDITSAIESFEGMFSNEYISTLAVIIEQSLRTGQTSKMFDDIKKQLEDIDIRLLAQEKIRIQRKISITQLMIYFSVIAASLFIAAVSLKSGMNF